MANVLLGRPEHVVFHESLSPRDTTTAAQIEDWHTSPKPNGNGWSSIGYHYVIDGLGEVWPTLPLHRLGIHVAGQNAGKIGVCITGDNRKPAERWSALQIIAGFRLLRHLQAVFPGIEYGGHRDYDEERTCPDADVRYLFDIVSYQQLTL